MSDVITKLFPEDEAIMLDTETMGVDNRSAVFAIAALKFNPNGRDLLPQDLFPEIAEPTLRDSSKEWVYCISLEDNIKYNRNFNQGTIGFWSERHDLMMSILGKHPMQEPKIVFDYLVSFCGELPLYANPPSFDMGILKDFMALTGNEPWKHWTERCFRTTKNLSFTQDAPQIKQIREWYGKNGDLHDPLVDCKHQAASMQWANYKFQQLIGIAQ